MSERTSLDRPWKFRFWKILTSGRDSRMTNAIVEPSRQRRVGGAARHAEDWPGNPHLRRKQGPRAAPLPRPQIGARIVAPAAATAIAARRRAISSPRRSRYSPRGVDLDRRDLIAPIPHA